MPLILGIDCGWSKPGFAVVKQIDPRTSGEVIHAEYFETKAMDKGKRKKLKVKKYSDDARRVIELADRITWFIHHFKPDVTIIEMPTSGGQSASALKGMCMGSATFVATLHTLGIVPIMITPTDNKRASGGNRELEKQLVWDSVRRTWPKFDGWPRMKKFKDRFDDEGCWAIADALSTVQCYQQSQTPAVGRSGAVDDPVSSVVRQAAVCAAGRLN